MFAGDVRVSLSAPQSSPAAGSGQGLLWQNEQAGDFGKRGVRGVREASVVVDCEEPEEPEPRLLTRALQLFVVCSTPIAIQPSPAPLRGDCRQVKPALNNQVECRLCLRVRALHVAR